MYREFVLYEKKEKRVFKLRSQFETQVQISVSAPSNFTFFFVVLAGFIYIGFILFLSMMLVFHFLKSVFGRFRRDKRGGPILEEILLIGVAVLIFAIIFVVIFNLIDWATVSIGDLFG